ncbi:MAG: DinB family protein [Candidatus Hydrogenedentales bacterium]|jgi:uncharacterized damage-inducible protein DinB
MAIIDSMLPEYEQEMAITRKTLERVTDALWDYKPHPKSMALGALASHIVESQGWIEGTIQADEWVMDMATYKPFLAANRDELLKSFDTNVADAKKVLKGVTDAQLAVTWSMKNPDGSIMFAMPRGNVLRTFMLNHTIHHRAQLQVYLRMNDIPVPSIYGPTADDSAGM